MTDLAKQDSYLLFLLFFIFFLFSFYIPISLPFAILRSGRGTSIKESDRLMFNWYKQLKTKMLWHLLPPGTRHNITIVVVVVIIFISINASCDPSQSHKACFFLHSLTWTSCHDLYHVDGRLCPYDPCLGPYLCHALCLYLCLSCVGLCHSSTNK